MGIELHDNGNGIWTSPGARIIDRAGRGRLPIGDDGFTSAVAGSVLVDKTALIADVLDSNYKATLFCRPRRFGKTLNMTMMKAFFEAPPAGAADPSMFEGTEIWEMGGGAYCEHFAAYPVIYLSMRTAKGDTWEQTYAALRDMLAAEIERHSYLAGSPAWDDAATGLFDRMRTGAASESDYAGSLLYLARLLRAHHGRPVVLLVDEYDAPVMAGYSAPGGGYYREVVTFLKRLLTGPLKDGGEVLAFACLTGVQRISKESIFSDLNNLMVSTTLSTDSDERFGFTDDEVAALLAYAHHPDVEYMEEARRWYDGYRFGRVDVYNPWSVLCYVNSGCVADVYWGNTSGNGVLGSFISRADARTLDALYELCEPGGTVNAPLDLNTVFPDIGASSSALWSMLYLAGYLTTDDPKHTGEMFFAPYRLRVPNKEVSMLYKREIIERFTAAVGGLDRYYRIHEALRIGEADSLNAALHDALNQSTSFYDMLSENSAHMLMTGLLYGMPGYHAPRSNGESGSGRFDLQLVPDFDGRVPADYARPLITIEFKFMSGEVDEDALRGKALEGVEQIRKRGYDEHVPNAGGCPRLRWGIAFCGKRAAAVCERA